MKNAGLIICALLILVSASWGTDTPPKKFHTSSPHPHHSLAQTEGAGHARSSGGASVLPSKSQSAHQKELEQIEHQNSMHVQAQSRQRSAKAAGQAPRVHPEPTGRNSGINFSYHSPHTQSTGASGARKH